MVLYVPVYDVGNLNISNIQNPYDKNNTKILSSQFYNFFAMFNNFRYGDWVYDSNTSMALCVQFFNLAMSLGSSYNQTCISHQ